MAVIFDMLGLMFQSRNSFASSYCSGSGLLAQGFKKARGPLLRLQTSGFVHSARSGGLPLQHGLPHTTRK